MDGYFNILNEVAIYKDPEKKMSIGIYPTVHRNFMDDPYIKVFTGSDPSKNNIYICRISIIKVTYVYHNTDSSKQNIWYLSNKEKIKLNNIMNSPYRSDSRFTNWDEVLIALSRFNECSETYQELNKRIPQPDFRKVK